MERMVDEALRLLHEFIGREEFAEELAEARKEFFRMVGTPLPGEANEELRFGSFTEWFILDRPLRSAGRTPLEEYLARHRAPLAGDLLAVFQALPHRVHSVFLVEKRTPKETYLLDLYAGTKYKKTRRVPISLGKRDMAELRLIPLSGEWYATDSYCHHPFEAKKIIAKMLKLAFKNKRPLPPLIIQLMAMNTRHGQMPKTAKIRAYEIK